MVIIAVKPTPLNAGGLLIAFYCTQFFLAQGNMIISLVSRNIAGQTKKSTTISMTFIGWAASNMAAPQIFQDSDAPRYIHGFIAHLVVYGIYVALVVVTRILLMKRNRDKRKAVAQALGTQEGVPDEKITHSLAFQDLTDLENPNFRYVY